MDSKLLKLFNGHVYFNLKILKNKVLNEIPSFIRNEDILNYFPEGAGPYGKETMKSLPFKLLRRLIAEIRISLFDPNGSITKTADIYDEWTEKDFLPFCEKLDKKINQQKKSPNLIRYYELAKELDTKMIDHFRLVRYGIPVHNIGMNLITRYLLKKFLGEENASKYFPILISGLDHKLKETNEMLHELAEIIKRSPELMELFQQEKSEMIYQKLTKSFEKENRQEINNFNKQFQKFLQKYGDRGFTREAYYPRWREQPKYVVDILKSLIIKHDKDLNLIKEKNKKLRKRIEKYVETKIRGQKFGFLKWKLFSIILKFSRRYIIFRELQRFNLDQWINRNRKIYL
jgi:hypothetical protein